MRRVQERVTVVDAVLDLREKQVVVVVRRLAGVAVKHLARGQLGRRRVVGAVTWQKPLCVHEPRKILCLLCVVSFGLFL